MNTLSIPRDFEEFRALTRALFANEVPPEQIDFRADDNSLFAPVTYSPQEMVSTEPSALRTSAQSLR